MIFDRIVNREDRDSDELFFRLKVSQEDLKRMVFKTDPSNGRIHSCLTIDGKNYRCRSECLVIRDNKVFALKLGTDSKEDLHYVIPGGSLEPGIDIISNAIKETHEEARINVRDCIWTGIAYGYRYIKSTSKFFNYYGAVSFICIGYYDSKYTGQIDMNDTEPEMLKYGKFYNPSEIDWMKYHEEVLRKFDIMK